MEIQFGVPHANDVSAVNRRADFIHALAILFGFAALVLVAAPPALVADPTPADLEFFEKRTRPLLVEHCAMCHGADKQKGGLRLDSRAAVLQGGDTGAAIEPGKPDESLLVEAIRYMGDNKMPPKGKLPDEKIVLLTEWVQRGAPWPAEVAKPQAAKEGEFDLAGRRAKQWAFQPLKTTAPPAVRNEAWVKSGIDRFILAKLESHDLAPAKPADKRTLLRRVTYDLIGLPPTPTEIDAFLADNSPRAFETVVNRLLDSPHYGERWARHWLDLVRFAETAGHEFDFEMPLAYEYRDYVIRALNADLPYDQFVTEHIAGDLLPQPRRHPTERFNESVIATGFWFLGEGKHSPVDIRADECERVDNQIDVFAKTFLAATVGCARCHDHKFDAISTNDYYALAGFLQSSRYHTACIDPPETRRDIVRELTKLLEKKQRLLGVSSSRPANPDRGAAAQITAELQREQVFDDFSRPDFSNWFVTGEAFGAGPLRTPFATLTELSPATLGRILGAGVVHSGVLSHKLEGTLRSQTFTIGKGRIHYHVAGRATQVNLIIDGFQKIRNPIYGGLTIALDHDDLRWRSQEVSKWIGHNAYIELLDEGPGYLALDRIVFSNDPPQQIDPKEPGRAAPVPAPKDLAAITEERRQLESRLTYSRKVMSLADGTSEDEHVLLRGNPKKPGEIVPRRFLEAIAGGNQPPLTQGSGRLELARRMVDPANPLLARVIVNRLWQHHFGEGLARTPDDFGNMGQPPTHPELLDWLAHAFISGVTPPTNPKSEIPNPKFRWSLKHLHRLMLLSNTYQMSSRPDDSRAEELDPQNKLLHRMPLRRLEGEIIRDAILAVSGRLDYKMYGPGVMPYLTPFMDGRGKPGKSGPLDGDGRRSIYLNVRRNFLTPMFLAFDYPVPFSTMGRRSVSNVPAQALALMNNPFVVQQSEVWAKKVLAEHADPTARITAMYAAALSRLPDTDELQVAKTFIDEQSRPFGMREELQAWSALAHVLLNVKEFIFVN